MARPPTVPAPEDKIGKKIDFIAKRLALSLAPHGFEHKGRTLFARRGEGKNRCWWIVGLQGNKWNAGNQGGFFVNLSVQFPAIHEELSQLAENEWRRELIDKVDEAAGQFRCRIETALPADIPDRFDLLADLCSGGEVNIRPTAPLDRLADQLASAICSDALRWFEARTDLVALRDAGSEAFVGVDNRIAAAILLGDRDAGNRLLTEVGLSMTRSAEHLAVLRQWVKSAGLDPTPIPTAPPTKHKDSYFARREQAHREAASRLAEEVSHVQIDATDWTIRLPEFIGAWVAELQSRWPTVDVAPLVDLALGQWIAAAPTAIRIRAITTMLEILADREARSQHRLLDSSVSEFDFDNAITILCKPLLAQLPGAPLEQCRTILGLMTQLLSRRAQDIITSRFPWPFAALIRWLDVNGRVHRQALKPDIARLLNTLREVIVCNHGAVSAAFSEHLAKPLDQNSPFYDLEVSLREDQLALLAQRTPNDEAALLRRLGDYPEQVLAREDRDAIRILRRWLLRDSESDAVPFAFDGDDWGQQAQAALDALPQNERALLAPALEWFAQGVEKSPSRRWFKTLDEFRANCENWSSLPAWLLDRLREFPHTDGQIEWATTGARPGVGTKLGETSESVLIGWLWWTQKNEQALPADDYSAVLRGLVAAAWRHIPEIGARAPSVGSLAMRLLATTATDREWIRQFAHASKKKQILRASEDALRGSA